jgi:NADH dehydrogenase
VTRIAVTGANGFVGRHLTRLLGSQGFEVDGVVRSKEAARATILAGAHPVIVPGLEEAPLARAFKGASAVVHLAQIGAERDGASYEAVNVAGTRAVMAAARAANVEKLVFLSGLGVARYGVARRCTNPYFLSKRTAEAELAGSGLAVTVFRPSWVIGPGSELVHRLVQELLAGEVELVGDGSYRLQPIAVKDAAAAILAALERSAGSFDLVGPEPLRYREFVERVALTAREHGVVAAYEVRQTPVEQAERSAAAGGYRGMLSDELDCLLCDEVADHRPLEALLGRFLTPLHDALATVLRAERAVRPA